MTPRCSETEHWAFPGSCPGDPFIDTRVYRIGRSVSVRWQVSDTPLYSLSMAGKVRHQFGDLCLKLEWNTRTFRTNVVRIGFCQDGRTFSWNRSHCSIWPYIVLVVQCPSVGRCPTRRCTASVWTYKAGCSESARRTASWLSFDRLTVSLSCRGRKSPSLIRLALPETASY